MSLVALFLLLTLALSLALLPIWPSLRELRRPRDAGAMAVDALERHDTRHFAQRFRALVDTEIAPLLDPVAAAGDVLTGEFAHGEPYVIVPGSKSYDPHNKEHDAWRVERMLFSSTELNLPDALELRREAYAREDLRVGRDCLLRAAYTEGDAHLADGAATQRWLHAEGSVYVGAECALHGRTSAENMIQFRGSSGFERLRAPRIEIGPRELHDSWRPPRAELRDYDLAKLGARVELAGGRARIRGDLSIPEGSVVSGDLVVGGDLQVGKDARIQGSVKVHGTAKLRAGVLVTGSLIVLQNCVLGPGCRIRGPLLVEQQLRVGGRCQIGDAVAPSTVRARRIDLSAGCTVHGLLWATERGWVRV
jgi:predicted acyltransferase (DUF342 family)